MGRFLTPSKIALLVLAQIYSKGSIPLCSNAKVLNVLISRILLDPSDSEELLRQHDGNTILDLERALTGQASVIPGRTVWDLLLKGLWAIDCADALDWFITEAPSLLGKTRDELLKERDEGLPPQPAGKIVRTSALGVFIRRCSLEYLRLQFQDSTALWMDLIAYRMPTKGAFARKNPNALRSAFDCNLADLELDVSNPLTGIMFRRMLGDVETQQKAYSTHESEKLMEFQVSEMQSLGGRLPDTMKARLKQLVDLGTSAPKLTHYLKFLDSWRAGDFTSAFDNLHRYFDYTMQSRDRTFYQYALLNLAILQADFGCHAEAIPAMQEAIATARENRDTICLNYCMSWLYHFGRAFPAQMQSIREAGILGNETEGLNFLKSRAKEAEMWTLLSTSLLSEAKMNLQHGGSLAMCFENIVKASHINVVKNVPNCTGPALLMKSTFFSRTGQTHQAYSCGERFLLCHAKNAPMEDVLKCTVRQGTLLAQMGRPSESQTTMANMPPHILKVLKYKVHHTTHTLILQARHLLHRDQLDAASQIIGQLIAQQPHAEADTSSQVSLLEIELLIRRRELMTALQQVHGLADKVSIENNDVSVKCRLMTLKASLFAKSGKALQGFSLATRAVELAFSARILPGIWEASLAVIHILLQSHEFAAARDLATAVLPQALECLDCDLIGRCFLLLADSYVGLAGLEAGLGNQEQKEKEIGRSRQRQIQLLSSAAQMLEKAGEQFRRIQELEGQLEVLAKMGRLSIWRGDVALANELGEKYITLKDEYTKEGVY
ncbi:APC5 protein [Knufia fluminis]|uniref:Anaphase-promoting complex subunit 5 n=1 Tax=Knufia fluminis TaxID=191047 RepID=A0AAN8I4S5_9EURO|nr:APC5 protein [Knufia fluminis]